MTTKMKLKICELRYEGKSIHEIAGAIGLTYQAVSNFLSMLPKNTGKRSYPKLEMETILLVCSDYINGYAIAEITEMRGVSQHDVLSVFWFITSRKPIAVKNSLYPSVSFWMQKHFYSLKDMSVLLDTTPGILREVLAGKRHMSYSLATKIRDVTSIPLHIIFNISEDKLAEMISEAKNYG